MFDCREPAKWPPPPEDMSFSTLKSIEQCPRQWALHTAEYPSLWKSKGYPPRVAIRTLLGTIAHSVVDRLTREFVAAGCNGVNDAQSIAVMKALGGYTMVITAEIDAVLSSCRQNPRAANLQDYIERTLRSKSPEIRGYVQALLSRVQFGGKPASRPKRGEASDRAALPAGLYPELMLKASTIRWKGKLDLLALDPPRCEIVEFKTGQANASHSEQLRMYAALWWMDQERNPARLPATRLTIAYLAGNQDVSSPTEQDLEQLTDDMARRSMSARAIVERIPPEAKPTTQGCRSCGVRQLCGEYWTPGAAHMTAPDEHNRQLADVQATVTGRHGATSWDAKVEIGTRLPADTRVLIRSGAPGLMLRRGQRIRILDGWVSEDPDAGDTVRVVTLHAQSEIYCLE